MTTLGLLAAGIVTAQSWRRATRERDTADAANTFFEGVLGSVSPFSLGHDPTVEDLLARTADRAKSELIDRPEVELRTRMTLIRAHVALWKWEQVRKESRRALVLARQLHGPASKEAADCLNFLGRAQTWMRDEAAIATQRQAYEIRQDLYPPDHPAIAQALVTLGFATWKTARPPRHDEAEAFYRKGIEMFRRGGSTGSTDYARALYSFANLLQSRGGNPGEILDNVSEAVDRFEQLDLPPDRYGTSALFMYASVLIEHGQAGAGLTRLRAFVEQVPDELFADIPLNQAHWLIGLIERVGGDREQSHAAFRRAIELECRARTQRGPAPPAWNCATSATRTAATFPALVEALHGVVDNLRSSDDPADEQLLERIAAVTTLAIEPAEVAPAERLVERILSTLTGSFPQAACAPDVCSVARGYLAAVDGRVQEAEAMLDSSFKSLRTQRGDFDLFTQLALSELIRLSERRGADGKAAYLRKFVTALAAPNVD